ncbi:MAG: FAD-dependent oxidoreductase [Methanocorpusculum sp.]|nr:FAD-dependent oxidoreductase [Methanocorpusculum sp.]MDD2470940.1 FAD-dependent oxidoreductase [Methanocorpusculum sp.]MDD3257398.1 FAD-dependent oxidoreductase [Methanocorpusculum sp.]
MKWAILGGGLTGVTLARLLKEKGHDVMVLEKEPKIGGLCKSETRNGFTFDCGGSHIIFSRDGEVLSFMQNVLEKNREFRNRNTKIFYKGQYIKYPFENGLSALPKEDLFFCINEYIKNLIAVEKGIVPEPKNFKDWIYCTFGKGIAECYLVPYNEKIWNYPADKMSKHWMDGRVPRPPVEDIIKSAIGIETEGYTHQAVFSYPVDGGIESLIHAIAEPTADSIKTNFTVTSVMNTGDGWTVSNGREIISADRVISTLPLQTLLPMLHVPAPIREACDALRYNSIACVSVGFKGTVPDISWMYVPEDKWGAFNRLSFPSNFSSRVAPEGCSAVLAEITFNEGDDISKLSDAELISHTVDGLVKMGILPSKDVVVHTAVDRFKFAYVVYDLEYQKNIKIVREYLEGTLSVDLVGRFSEFEYINMDGCIRSAMNFVEKNA